MNYERDTVKFCGADKGAIQIKRSPFPPLPRPRPFTYATLPLHSFTTPISSLSLSRDVFRNPYSSSRLFRLRCRFQKRFPFPRFSRPNRPSQNSCAGLPPLSLLRCTYKNNSRRVKSSVRSEERKREKLEEVERERRGGNRTSWPPLRFHPLSLAPPRTLGVPPPATT